MTATITATQQTAEAATGLSVTVVDGNGLEVSGEPVTARFHGPGTLERVVVRTTDSQGVARFEEPEGFRSTRLVLSAGRETYTDRLPISAARLTIEM